MVAIFKKSLAVYKHKTYLQLYTNHLPDANVIKSAPTFFISMQQYNQTPQNIIPAPHMLIATPAIAPYHHQDIGYAIILKRQFIISTLYACVGFFKQSKPVRYLVFTVKLGLVFIR